MRILVLSLILGFQGLSGPAAAQQAPLAVSVSPLPTDEGGLVAEPGVSLTWLRGCDVHTGQSDLVDFTAYAVNFSAFRVLDGRILSIALPAVSNRGPSQVVSGRLDHGIPSSTPVDPGRVFLSPSQWPTIEGYKFLDGFRSWRGDHDFVGLWKNETSQERLLVAFDDPASASGEPNFKILGRTDMVLDVVSVYTPLHHAGSPLISMATSPTAAGSFRILTYQWRDDR